MDEKLTKKQQEAYAARGKIPTLPPGSWKALSGI